MAIKIEVISDVSKVVSETGKLADKYDDVSDTLKDLAKDGEKAGDKIEKAFKDGIGDELEKGLEDGEKAAKSLADKTDAAFDSISDSARASGKDVEKSSREGFEGASEGAQTLADEADSNAKEVAASFDGSAESILDGFQGLAAEMFSGFGPAGMAAGVLVAAGIGLAVTKMQEGAEEATAMKEAAVSMVGAIADAGGDLKDMDLSGIISDWGREVIDDNWLTFWADESSTNFQDVAKKAKATGVDVKDAIRGMKGSVDESKGFLDGTAKEWERLGKVIEEGTTFGETGAASLDASAEAAKRQRKALGDLRDGAQENIDTTADAIEIYGIETDALGRTAEAADAAAEAVKKKADASDAAANAAMGVVGAENDWIVTLAQMNKDIESNGKTLDSNTEAGRANKESLVDLAGSANGYRDAAIAAGEGTEAVTGKVQASREAFLAAAEAAGYDAGEAEKLADKYGLIPGNVATLVEANGTEEAKAKIEGIPAAKDTTVTTTETGAAEASAKIDAVDGKDVTVETAEKGAAEAQSKIDAIKGKTVDIGIQAAGNDASNTQIVIDRIHGKTVDIGIQITNEQDILNRLARLTQPRSVDVTINQRFGTAATP